MKTKLSGQYKNTSGKNPSGHFCEYCLEKEDVISQLREELRGVKQKLRNRDKDRITKKDVDSAAHTPPSRKYKSTSTLENRDKKGGAKEGHIGRGRKSAGTGAPTVVVEAPLGCPCCHLDLIPKGVKARTLVDVDPIKARRLNYEVKKGQCPRCKKTYQSPVPCFPKTLYANRLLAQAAVMHYVHGMPMGRLLKIFGSEVTEGGLFQAFHRLGGILGKAKEGLLSEFRKSAVKHADETGWRTDGATGFTWIFATDKMSWFELRNTRGSKVPKEIFGDEQVEGVLVVDRFNAYNKLPVKIQYCYAHLLREVVKLEKEFPDSKEVSWFVEKMSKALSEAMKLRSKKLGMDDYLLSAKAIRSRIEREVGYDYEHLGIRRIQQIFKAKSDRMYHWACDPNVPAENNLAEREIRPTVIARKTSFGSQSEQGAMTRSTIMSYLFTAKKRLGDFPLEDWFVGILNKLSADSQLKAYDLLPP